MMNPSTLHPVPRWQTVIKEQFRSAWIATRGVVGVGGALTLAVTLFLIVTGEGVPFVPELGFFVALPASLLPIAAWKGGYHFRRSYPASLPVSRTRHVAIKIAAGWVWLMMAVAAFMLWMLAFATFTGGQIGMDGMRVLAEHVPAGASPEEAAAVARPWTTPMWQWAAFFTGTTATYLFGSAVVLASSRTRRWLAAVAVVFLFVSVVDDEVIHLWGVAERLDWVLLTVAESRYGLETVITGIGETDYLTTASGELIGVWRTPPTVKTWLVATILWIGLAAATVLAVIWFDRKD